MSDAVERLKPLLDQLTEEEVGEVIDYLVGVPPGIMCEGDPGFDEMLERRFKEIESGQVVGIPAEEVFAKLDAKYFPHRSQPESGDRRTPEAP